MRRALARLVRLSGFEARTFASGEEFLRSLTTHRPDCLVLDLYLPGMTGFDVQEWLNKAGLCIPVVAITGHDYPMARQRALQGGAWACLRKPVSEEALIPAIEACLAVTPPASLDSKASEVGKVGGDEEAQS